MSAVLDLIRTVEENGGQLRVEDGWLVISPGEAAKPFMEALRQYKAEIVGLLQSERIPRHDPAEWREPFLRWLGSACVRSPRWFTNMTHLHRGYCEWEVKQDGVPCTRHTFECLVRESGFLIPNGLVAGLALREDFQAHELWQREQ